MAEKRKILIVDDEMFVAFGLCDMVEDMGMDVVGPSMHADEAEKMADQDQIDLALLDVNLGNGRTSESVANRLRARHIPIIFVTAAPREEVAYCLPGDKLIHKPTSAHILSTEIDRTLAV